MKGDACRLHSQSRGHALDHIPDRGKSLEGGVQNSGCTPQVRINLLEQLQLFPADFGFECAEAGNVAPGTCDILDEPATDRIGYHDEYDWNAAGHSL